MFGIDEQYWLSVLLFRVVMCLIRLFELLQVRIEQKLDIKGPIAERTVKETIEKRACQHEVILFQSILEFFTLDEINIQCKLIHVTAIE